MNPESLRAVVEPTYKVPLARATQAFQVLYPAMAQAGITTPFRIAAFVAQVAHESGGFQYLEELASGQAYEGRADLGNTQPGDGVRFKGRGYIQLTGRANYAAASKDLGLDLIAQPSLAAEPDVAARLATWFWTKKGLNQIADQGPSAFDTITRRINGALLGKDKRDSIYYRGLSAMGIDISDVFARRQADQTFVAARTPYSTGPTQPVFVPLLVLSLGLYILLKK